MLRLVVIALVVVTRCSAGFGQSGPYFYSLPDLTVSAEGSFGSVVVVEPTLDSSLGGEVSAYGFSICHDLALLQVDAIEQSDDLLAFNNGAGADFFVSSIETGFVNLGVVPSTTFVEGIVPTVEFSLATIHYRIVATGTFTALLQFCNGGTPPVENLLVVGIEEWEAVLGTGSIAVGESFLRGDANGNGSLSLGDAVLILAWLFANGTEPLCVSAADSNDSETISLGDSLTILAVLFTANAPTMAAPFPTCGLDPTPGDLGCQQIPTCP